MASLNSFFRNKTILITGSAGYLGSSLSKKLAQTSCILIRAFHKRKPQGIKSNALITDIRMDLTSKKDWLKVISSVDIIYHLAGQTSSYKAQSNPKSDFQSNVVPVIALMEACRETGRKPIVIAASTVTIVGLALVESIDETVSENPITIYDLHKVFMEKYLIYATNKKILSGIILRLPNVYGPSLGISREDRGILNKSIWRARNNKSLTVWDEGLYIRDYVFIEDIVDAFVKAAEFSNKLTGKYFILGSGIGTPFLKVMELVERETFNVYNFKPPLVSIKPPLDILEIEKRNFIANAGEFTRLTGWNPDTDIVNGVIKTLRSFSEK